MGNPVLLKKKKYIYIYINFYRLHSGLCLEKRWPIYFNNSVVKTNYLVMLGEGLLLAKGFFSTVIVFTGGSPLSREIVSACLIRRTSCAATTMTLDHWQDQNNKGIDFGTVFPIRLMLIPYWVRSFPHYFFFLWVKVPTKVLPFRPMIIWKVESISIWVSIKVVRLGRLNWCDYFSHVKNLQAHAGKRLSYCVD